MPRKAAQTGAKKTAKRSPAIKRSRPKARKAGTPRKTSQLKKVTPAARKMLEQGAKAIGQGVQAISQGAGRIGNVLVKPFRAS